MRYKAVFAMGLAAGYVLGARAGRQRYEQIKRMSKSISSNPSVKHTADAVQAQATQLGMQARKAMQEKAGTVGHDLYEKVTSKLPSGMSSRFAHHTIDLNPEQRYAEPTYSDGSMT
jgi:hypothetical protein